jgi:hypothetical protein
MVSTNLSPDSPEVELSSDNSVDRTNQYNKATNDVKYKVDKILSILPNISINEAQEIIRISGSEVYADAKKHLDSTFEFIQSAEYVI